MSSWSSQTGFKKFEEALCVRFQSVVANPAQMRRQPALAPRGSAGAVLRAGCRVADISVSDLGSGPADLVCLHHVLKAYFQIHTQALGLGACGVLSGGTRSAHNSTLMPDPQACSGSPLFIVGQKGKKRLNPGSGVKE